MTNYLKMGAETLQERMEAYGGVQVMYRRVSSKLSNFSFNIVAVPGRNPVDVVNSEGVVLRSQIQDFVVSIAKMQSKMSADPKTPVRGDEIVMKVGRHNVVFIVTADDFATSHYEPADSYGVAWRIHSKADRLA